MLLTLQNPKAEMCGTIDQWNNIGRYIRRGEHSTAVFRSRTDTQLMYLFDVRQTYGKAYNSKWKLSERMADGIGGSSRNDDPVSFSNHDGKGIELVLNNRQIIRFNWKKVAEAVRSAVNSGKYITESDIETRRRMTLFDAQRFAIHYEYPHCLYNDRLDYIRKEIAACGLDYPIRLNAEMFAVYAAECVRTKPHVKESYQKIDRSSIDIPWKFNDWNEAAEAGKNLPVDSGYGQFRAMCRDSVSELINEISTHTGHNPALGFPEEEITEFFASGEPLTSDSVDKITSEVFGYLYNQKQHSRLNSSKQTEIAAPEQPAEQFTLFGDNEFTMEEPSADELPDESLNRAAAYIKDYFEQEFGSAAEIEDPSHVDLAYTTDEENDAVISVYADLVQYRITTEYGGNIVREEQYNSLDEMNELALKFLSFDDLISLSDEEKGLEVRHGAAVESNESEVRHGVAVEAELRGVHAALGLRQQQHPVAAPAQLTGRIEKYDLDIDFSKLDYIEIEERSDVYLGGIDDNGHERKDNFRETVNHITFFASPENDAVLFNDDSQEDYFDNPIEISEALELISRYIDRSAESADVSVYIKSIDGERKYIDPAEVRHGVAVEIETTDRAHITQKPPPPENYRFPENFAYPTGPKAKYTANVTAIKTLKQIESEHRHATADSPVLSE